MSTATSIAGRESPVPEAWTTKANVLATWASRLINQPNAHGRYLAKKFRTPRKKALTEKKGTTLGDLRRHFRGIDGACVGLHTTSPDSTSLFGVIDIDCHREGSDPEANFRLALHGCGGLLSLGLTPLLIDSDGRGGFHIWVLFAAPAPTADVEATLQWAIRDWKRFVHDQPECFPKQGGVTEKNPFGNWVRLPGLHYQHAHYSRAWDFEDERWLEGEAAISAIVCTPRPFATIIPDEVRKYAAEAAPKKRARTKATTGEPGKGSDSQATRIEDRDVKLALAADALKHLGGEYCDDYKKWLEVGFALRGLDQDGLRLWDEWSKQNKEKYDPAVCAEKWQTMGSDGGVGLGSLFAWATGCGWVGLRNGRPYVAPFSLPGADGQATSNGDGHHAGNETSTDEPDWAKIGEEAADQAARDRVLDPFANYAWKEVEDDSGEPKSVKVALSMMQLSDQLDSIVGTWPKRVVEMLFSEGPDYEPTYLTSSARLFAWLSRYAQVDWMRGAQYVTQEQFYEHLRMTCERYEAIEVLPHHPSIPHLFYMHQSVPRPTGKLDELLKFYSPLTDVDGELIRAMLYTWFWGGAPGARPAFQITGPEGDPEQGRGLGKSKLMESLSVLVDGYLDVNPSDSIGDTKIRLLSSEARHMRVCRLDNLKAHRFNWGELEGFITAAVISGRMLYVGEGRRPNTLTWVITVNGSSMSKDMAQRLIPVMLARPAFTAAWEENVIDFINANRWAIIADILQALEKTAPAYMKPSGRWAAWERDVLSKTALLTECQEVIKERQGLIDDDKEEADLVREAFRDNLECLCRKNPDALCILIPSRKAAEWLSECCRKPFATNQASGHIRTLGIKELSPSRENTGRGWVWRGKDVPASQGPLRLDDFDNPMTVVTVK